MAQVLKGPRYATMTYEALPQVVAEYRTEAEARAAARGRYQVRAINDCSGGRCDSTVMGHGAICDLCLKY